MNYNEKICYIVGAAPDNSPISFVKNDGDTVIAADGGRLALEKNNIIPDAVIGDFDSSEYPLCDKADSARGFAYCEKDVIRLNPIKDITDMTRCVRYGIDKGYRRFEIYGCIGGRTSHTLANIQMAADMAAKGYKCTLHGCGEIMTVLSGEKNNILEFDESSSGFISVFSLSDKSVGVCESELKYCITDYTMTNLFPIGVSNEFIGKRAKISLKSGILLVICTEKAYFLKN